MDIGTSGLHADRGPVNATPNVRAKRATTAGRQARAVENAAAPQTGPGGLPLALRLSEGLGVAEAEPSAYDILNIV